jgi:hypothetical protein
VKLNLGYSRIGRGVELQQKVEGSSNAQHRRCTCGDRTQYVICHFGESSHKERAFQVVLTFGSASLEPQCLSLGFSVSPSRHGWRSGIVDV